METAPEAFWRFIDSSFAPKTLSASHNRVGYSELSLKGHLCKRDTSVKRTPIVRSDQFRFLGNCPHTPPLSHHFALSEK